MMGFPVATHETMPRGLGAATGGRCSLCNRSIRRSSILRTTALARRSLRSAAIPRAILRGRRLEITRVILPSCTLQIRTSELAALGIQVTTLVTRAHGCWWLISGNSINIIIHTTAPATAVTPPGTSSGALLILLSRVWAIAPLKRLRLASRCGSSCRRRRCCRRLARRFAATARRRTLGKTGIRSTTIGQSVRRSRLSCLSGSPFPPLLIRDIRGGSGPRGRSSTRRRPAPAGGSIPIRVRNPDGVSHGGKPLRTRDPDILRSRRADRPLCLS